MGSSVLFLTKRNSSSRMCVDYRAFKLRTVQNSYSLPRIDYIFDQLTGSKYFSKINLGSGYHQIRMDEYSIHLTAFRTGYGHLKFLVLPFILTNAPATFMGPMNDFFRMTCGFFIVYLDEIHICNNMWEENLKYIAKLLEVLTRERVF